VFAPQITRFTAFASAGDRLGRHACFGLGCSIRIKRRHGIGTCLRRYPRLLRTSTLALAWALASLCATASLQVATAGQLLLVAGAVGDPAVTDGPLAMARFNVLAGIAVDGRGNIYLAEGHTIRRISVGGVVTTIAGKAGEWGDRDGPGGVARFNNPQGLAADATGNVYVADRDNQSIRKITPDGTVSTAAGSAASASANDGKGPKARFYRPSGIAVGSSGALFVSDTGNFTIRKISPAGVVSTIAGREGEGGYANGPAASARFNFPQGIAIDTAGNVYVADNASHAIRKISTGGIVTTLAGAVGAPAMGTADGLGAAARFAYPSGLAIDTAGNLYVADSHSRTIRKVTATGLVTTVAGMADRQGTDDGPGATARFASLAAIAVDHRGNIYVTDFAHVEGSAHPTYYVQPGPSGTVRRIDTQGVVSTLAGRASEPDGSADGIGSAAQFDSPSGIVADRDGTLYVTDSTAATVRKITTSGEVTTLAGKAHVWGHDDGPGAEARFRQTTGIALDSTGTIYVTDAADGVIRRITRDGLVSTFAGSPGAKGIVDGVGAAARLSAPNGIAVDGAGNLYVTDLRAFSIRKITPTRVVTTLAGQAGQHGSVDGPADLARFVAPAGIAVDHVGNLYVCDYGNATVRKITPHGDVSTLAGRAGHKGSADGTGPAAEFMGPFGIVVDDAGNLYVSDANTIRRITPAGAVTTVAGISGQSGIKLGQLPGRLENPTGVALINSRTLVLTSRHSVLKILLDDPPTASTTPAPH
jgi:sugar lactone lactonase YvrE